MPELPEVETVCRGLAEAMVGRRLNRVQVRRAGLRFPFPPELAERLTGRAVRAVTRRAKFFQIFLDDGQVALGHLGMSGRMLVQPGSNQPPPDINPGPHDHVIFDLEGGGRVTFCDPRRFGMLTLCTIDELSSHRMLDKIGPEPLDDAFTGRVLADSLKHRNGPIKTVLMDQHLVAGIGNIYASEALFRAGISPRRKASSVQGQRAERLVACIKQVLLEAIASGGSSLRDHRRPDGELGYFQHAFAVYDKQGQACPGCDCDLAKTGGISRMVQAGRATFYCSRKQR